MTLPKTIAAWIEYIQHLHHREIELSLERVALVYQRLCPHGVHFKVISIAGTNGKGSTAELITSIYHAAGYRVGKYTSPHLSRFNERFNIERKDVGDTELLEAFARVESARGTTTLTFFEFGTLMAIELFTRHRVDVAVMEVGLGGRLDAVNILEPDLACVTSISIDHIAWLGDSIEQIGREKIAIARADRPCVLGLAKPPQSIIDYCQQHGIKPLLLGADFGFQSAAGQPSWDWRSAGQVINALPLPFGQQGQQLSNAAVAVQAVLALRELLPLSEQSIIAGIANAAMRARCQLVATFPAVVLDVAHNVDSVAGLLAFVEKLEIHGRVYAVCGMLEDKQIAETLLQLIDTVDEWHFASINKARGANAAQVDDILRHALAKSLPARAAGRQRRLLSFQYDNARAAYHAAREKLKRDDCLLVFGSFFIVSDIIDLI